MLVPLEQMTATIDRPYDRGVFPAEYSRSFEDLTLSSQSRQRFDSRIASGQLAIHLVPLSEGMHEYTLGNFLKEEKEPKSPPELDRPWSRDKQWNLVVLDEGPPQPFSTHTRYKWLTSPRSFVEEHRTGIPMPALLNAAKLDRLLQRYAGELEDEPVLAKTGKPAHRLNYEALEQLDVVSGLLAYAEWGPEYVDQLARLYAEGTRKPLGAELSLEWLRSERNALWSKLGLEEGGGRGAKD
jgi:hypothetical protein